MSAFPRDGARRRAAVLALLERAGGAIPLNRELAAAAEVSSSGVIDFLLGMERAGMLTLRREGARIAEIRVVASRAVLRPVQRPANRRSPVAERAAAAVLKRLRAHAKAGTSPVSARALCRELGLSDGAYRDAKLRLERDGKATPIGSNPVQGFLLANGQRVLFGAPFSPGRGGRAARPKGGGWVSGMGTPRAGAPNLNTLHKLPSGAYSPAERAGVTRAFDALPADGCRYPIGDPREAGFRFCCVEVRRDIRSAYCGEHHALCWGPVQEVKANRPIFLRRAA